MNEDVAVRTLPARVHGRYLLHGPREGRPPLLLGFHGYGEDAAAQLDAMRRIPGSEGWLCCAVQALHPFYRTKTGEVVASWMTRLDREQAIEDNVAYVAGVVEAVRREVSTAPVVAVTGFSQGVAMAWRAATRAGFRCDALVALAGDVPPELLEIPDLAWPPSLIGCGRGDGWYTEARHAQDVEALRARGASVESCVFDGGHEWTDAFRERAGAFLRATLERVA